jgi:hypothetical protein
MKLHFDNDRVLWLGTRATGGIAIQQGRNRLLLSADELPVVVDAITKITTTEENL